MASASLLVCCGNQFLQYAACAGLVAGAATPLECDQLFFQCPHAGKPDPDLSQLSLDETVNVAAIGIRAGNEIQETFYFRERNVEGASVTDEGKSFQVALVIDAVTAGIAGRGR